MKTVITFGVYDILHLGHIRLFERARQLGDRLIVAVQDSDCILKYKPETRMVYSLQDRLYMVSAVKYVDEVIVYRDVDIDIQNIAFDIFVRGEDQVHNGFRRAARWCEQNGKEVATLPRTEGISSTMLRNLSGSENQ